MRAISSMATRHVLTALGAEAEREGLPGLELESVGGVDASPASENDASPMPESRSGFTTIGGAKDPPSA